MASKADISADDLAAAFDAEETTPKAPSAFTKLTDFEPPPPPKAARNTSLKIGLEKMYANIGTMAYLADPMIGTVILQQAEQCATSLDELAKTNPKVKKALMRMMESSSYGTVIAAHLPIAIAIATKYVPELRRNYEGTVGVDDQQMTTEDIPPWP